MDDINSYAEAISAACLSAASHAIPMTSEKRSGCIPGWAEYVESFKQKSQFWHNIWVDCGRRRAPFRPSASTRPTCK